MEGEPKSISKCQQDLHQNNHFWRTKNTRGFFVKQLQFSWSYILQRLSSVKMPIGFGHARMPWTHAKENTGIEKHVEGEYLEVFVATDEIVQLYQCLIFTASVVKFLLFCVSYNQCPENLERNPFFEDFMTLILEFLPAFKCLLQNNDFFWSVWKDFLLDTNFGTPANLSLLQTLPIREASLYTGVWHYQTLIIFTVIVVIILNLAH